MQLNHNYGVIGNPVSHSLSPIIHQQFAKQFGWSINYEKYLLETKELKEFIYHFFKQDGQGLNVTLPFKKDIIKLANEVSNEVAITQSANTLWLKNNKIYADSTDGKGLLFDLNKQGFSVKNKTILIVGAGGATQSILFALLNAGANVCLLNRTRKKVDALIKQFSAQGNISHYQSKEKVDGVISAVSEFNPKLFESAAIQFSQKTFCYDLNYGVRAEEFKQFALSNGCIQFSDGIGMLLAQAAYSFEIWTGKYPDIDSVDLKL